MRLVLVDPSRAVQRAMTQLIEGAGHQVVTFADGLQALACIARESDVRALITSTQPLGISGIELCAEVRKLSGIRRALHVILMSSTEDYHLAAAALDNGAVLSVKNLGALVGGTTNPFGWNTIPFQAPYCFASDCGVILPTLEAATSVRLKAVRLLGEYRRQIPAGLGHQIAAQFDDQASRRRTGDEGVQFLGDRSEVEFVLVRGVGDAEATADVDDLRTEAEHVGGAEGQVQAVAQAPGVTSNIALTTRGNHQSVSIVTPGTEVPEITVSLEKR